MGLRGTPLKNFMGELLHVSQIVGESEVSSSCMIVDLLTSKQLFSPRRGSTGE